MARPVKAGTVRIHAAQKIPGEEPVISVEWWVAAATLALIASLCITVHMQRNLINQSIAGEGAVEQVMEEAQAMLDVAEVQARDVQRGLDQMLLMSKAIEWQRHHDFEDFNELVMWDFAEDLSIDRTVASELYDRLRMRRFDDDQ